MISVLRVLIGHTRLDTFIASTLPNTVPIDAHSFSVHMCTCVYVFTIRLHACICACSLTLCTIAPHSPQKCFYRSCVLDTIHDKFLSVGTSVLHILFYYWILLAPQPIARVYIRVWYTHLPLMQLLKSSLLFGTLLCVLAVHNRCDRHRVWTCLSFGSYIINNNLFDFSRKQIHVAREKTTSHPRARV